MAYVALTSLVATIELEFLQPIPSKVSLNDDHQPPIKSFLQNLSSMREFVEKFHFRSSAHRDLETKIRDFALQAEDNIEIQLSNFVLGKDRDDKEKASQQLHQSLQEAAEKATELLNIMDKVSDDDDDDDNDEENNEIQPSSIHRQKHYYSSEFENDKWNGSSQSSPELVSRMIGRHRDREKIISNLIPNSFNFSFNQRYSYKINLVFIVGMVGIGKTTLAKSAYGDPQVEGSYNVRCWITIMPQEYNRREIIRLLLRSITPAAAEAEAPAAAAESIIGKGSTENLAEQVRTQLRGKRFLIVLDNIHDGRALHDIQTCVYCGDPESTILLTTGNFNLRFDPTFYSHKYTHYMTLLNPEESWNLFCNNMGSPKGRMALEFDKIKSHILEVCDGLPWSIVTVAKRLSKCRRHDILKEWEKIKKLMESLGILDRTTLTYHYNQLLEHLKVFFLYFGVFPKRKEVQVKRLVGLWIAEGFIEALEDEELENQGYAYLQQLIDKSLLLMCNRGRDGKIKTCRMHSALHSFCVGEAQKAGIFCAVNTLQHTGLPLSEFAKSCRWLSLYTHSFDYYVLFSTNKPRSIFFFDDDDPRSFVPFKLLRVLAFVPSPFLQRVSMHLRDLVFLRYLFISQRFQGLGNIVSNNPNLHTLIVSSDEPQIGAPTIHLPSTIWELPHLRNLELGDMYTIDDPPSVVKMNLQTLSCVSPTHCGREVYFNFPNIRKLGLVYKQDLVPSHIDSSSNNPIILYNLDYLEWLERLTISISIGCIVTLPEQSMFPSQLKKLKLSGAKLSQKDLMAIGMLPELRVLKLENALSERVWEVAKGEFRKLKFLLLEDEKLKQFQGDERHTLLRLEHLVLRFCYCLEQIPFSFAARKLKHIELDRCSHSTVASARHLMDFSAFSFVKLIIDGVEYYEYLQQISSLTQKKKKKSQKKYRRLNMTDHSMFIWKSPGW